MRLTIKYINDLILNFGYSIDKASGKKGYFVYFGSFCIGHFETLDEACRGIKNHAKDTSLSKTIVVQFNHFIDENDWDSIAC